VGFGNNGLAKANLHGANDQKVLAGGDRESVGAGFTDSGYRKKLLLFCQLPEFGHFLGLLPNEMGCGSDEACRHHLRDWREAGPHG
jgi:hypothetical protein